MILLIEALCLQTRVFIWNSSDPDKGNTGRHFVLLQIKR